METRPDGSPQPRTVKSRIVFSIGVILSLSHLYFNTIGTLPDLWVALFHFAGFGLLCGFSTPDSATNQGWQRISIALGLVGVAACCWLGWQEVALYERGVNLTPLDRFAAVAVIVLALEWTRRTLGWTIPILIVIALSYVVWWGQWLEGLFNFPGLSLDTLLFRSVYGGEGMFGSIARISWSYVFIFILFGAFLLKSGAGDVIIDLARCAAGRWTGGPGLVAVVASGLMGSVSGSAVANTASTGVITIPLMQKAGFSPRFAAAIEAAASTGGQLMPPVMGAGAFIMANYTQVPYLQIIGYAALPALLYFVSIGFFVRVEARRLNIPCQSLSDQSFWQVLKQGWPSLLPIVILVAALVIGFTPTYAGCIAILGVVIASWCSRRPMSLRDIMEALHQGALNMTSTALLLVAVGLIVNVVTTTGIGNTFSLMISQWAQGSLLLSLILIAVASLILGMGLPVTASYIVLATLSAPVLYQLIAEQQVLNMMQAGNLPEQARTLFMLTAPDSLTHLSQPMTAGSAQALLVTLPADIKPMLLEQSLSPAMISAALVSAHMILFWLSQDSNVTPPVCLTAFAAAAIAKTPPMQTGLSAWKLAKGLYIIPLLFAYTPFIGGDSQQTLTIFFTAILGLYALVGVFQGHLEGPLCWWQRGLLMASSVLLLWPLPNLLWAGAGATGLIFVFIWSRRIKTSIN